MLSEQRKHLILSAAKEMFAIKGYHDTSISDIIKRGDIARGTFYLYFRDKRQIFDALFDQLLNKIDNLIERVVVGPDQKPPLEQIADNLNRVFNLVIDDPELARILFRHAPGLDIITDQKIDKFYNGITSFIQNALLLGTRMDIVKDCDIKLFSAFIMGGIREIMDRITRPDNDLPPLDILTRELLDFSLYGLTASGTAAIKDKHKGA